MQPINFLRRLALEEGHLSVCEVPAGYDSLVLADAARLRARERRGPILLITRDDARAQQHKNALAFFAPDVALVDLPAWDCLPYDRVSPRAEIISRRISALAKLANPQSGSLIVLSTVSAALQRLPPRAAIAASGFSAQVGDNVDFDALLQNLSRQGFVRVGTVYEPGEFAVRGGILDVFPPGHELPVRLDFFGDTLEAVRRFEPETQRTSSAEREFVLYPMSEAPLDPAAIQRFRSGYIGAFGAVIDDDPLYEAVSAGRRHGGFEHWLPLFYEHLESVFDYVEDPLLVLDHLAEAAREERSSLIQDHYEARVEALKVKEAAFGAPAYKALPPERLYLSHEEWRSRISNLPARTLDPNSLPEGSKVVSAGARQGRNFAPERTQEGANIFEAAARHVEALMQSGRKTLLVSWSAGSSERMGLVLKDHGLNGLIATDTFKESQAYPRNVPCLAIVGLEHGFEADGLAVLTEEDILGDRLVRPSAKRRRAENFLKEASALSVGDFVVHVDHGIGRYEGLRTIDAAGAPHDCLFIIYAGNDRLYVPVENIELLSRYGSDDANAELDRLGGAGWQTRKSRLKERIREIAHKLIRIAAERELKNAPAFHAPEGTYTEFCAGFPYQETDDQERAIGDVIGDLAKGRPMDRLICGDVGFGKTEVALRAAFITAMSGEQVALVVPTTLLARQHFQTFSRRFQSWPIKVRTLSRLVAAKEAAQTKQELAEGKAEIVIGTHALLAKNIQFKSLGLLIVDEEQHFGVKHKERLKELRADVHVLTLTATPIPRTLQLALAGVRDLSIIATPPIDRLAVRTYVAPFDPVTVREALLREHYRGGQAFYVCPRIADLSDAADFLRAHVPEVKFITAHGQMAPSELENVMTLFYDGKYDVLVSTTIVESGLDIPAANTLIVHRADMLGLAQLYQIRGRIGRSKTRAYAYLTVPPRRQLTPAAQKRLEVLQTLDTLGAGFTLASHDLDIRGAGNLLGEEQSGHIREVGIELYQDMLEEAVASLRSGETAFSGDDQWSPQINLGMAVLIPESYVADLDVRLALYRRLADSSEAEPTEALAAEFIDRFGPLPPEVENLLELVSIKRLCRKALVERIDAGPKGATIAFRHNQFPNPVGLAGFLQQEATHAKLRSDHRLTFMRNWDGPLERVSGTRALIARLAAIAEQKSAAA